MTLRSVLLGLIGACVICGLTYFNDVVMNQAALIGHHMPVSVYGFLLFFLLAINPLLFHIRKRLALTGGELAVILTLTLATCCIPAAGLVRSLPAVMIGPHWYAQAKPGADPRELEAMTSPRLHVDAGDGGETGLGGRSQVVDGFMRGVPRENPNRHISLSDIPWRGWMRPFRFWLPLVFALWTAVIGLSLVVHRQWSAHEHLPYPLAHFTNALLPDGGQARSHVLTGRLFWLGALPVLCIHLNNYASTWFPQRLVRVPFSFSLEFLFASVPILWRAHFDGGVNAVQGMMDFRFYLTVVAFTYFLPKDVSFSVGIGPYIMMWVAAFCYQYGLWGGDFPFVPKTQNMLTAGAYLGIFLAIVYTGRHYYLRVARRAIFLASEPPVDDVSVWGARLFALGIAGFVAGLSLGGLDWQLAVVFAAGLIVIFLVMSRILAETGMFNIMSWWSPGVLIMGIFGSRALGPDTILLLNLLAVVFVYGYYAIPCREALMPYLVNALKLLDLRQVRIGPCVAPCGVALCIGLAVALAAAFFFLYDRGALAAGKYHTLDVKIAYDQALNSTTRLSGQGLLEHSQAISGWDRFRGARPDTHAMAMLATGFGLVLFMSAARLRVPWWPIHPVMCLVWVTWPGRLLAASFLIGWFVKAAVTKYGGVAAYRKLQPLMYGIIAGEMLSGILVIGIGGVYYWLTGELPRRYIIIPSL